MTNLWNQLTKDEIANRLATGTRTAIMPVDEPPR